MIKTLKDNKNCFQDEQPSRFYFVTKNYGLKDKASLFLNDVFSLDFCVFMLKRQRRRIHCLYSRSSLCLKNMFKQFSQRTFKSDSRNIPC